MERRDREKGSTKLKITIARKEQRKEKKKGASEKNQAAERNENKTLGKTKKKGIISKTSLEVSNNYT